MHMNLLAGRDPHHIAECQFKALARALRAAVELDPRETGIPSHQGRAVTRSGPMTTVAVLDYGSGNLRSAVRAVERAGARGVEVVLTADREVAERGRRAARARASVRSRPACGACAPSTASGSSSGA